MNFAQLTAAVSQTTENFEASFVAAIPGFVRLAEQQIYNTVQIPALRKNITSALALGVPTFTLPADYLAMHSIAAVLPSGSRNFLLNKDVNFIHVMNPDTSVTGAPRYYAQYDADTLLIAPTPGAAYPVELHYYAYPASIVDAGVSWLGDNMDSVLLYGTLLHAYINMKGETDVLATYKQKYDEALSQLKRLGDGLNRRDSYRSGQVRAPVL